MPTRPSGDSAAAGREIPRCARLQSDAVIWNLDKVLNDKAPQFDKRQSAQVKTRLPSLRATPDRRLNRGNHDQTVDFVLRTRCLVPGLQPANTKSSQDWTICQPASHRTVQTYKTGAARTRRIVEERGLLNKKRIRSRQADLIRCRSADANQMRCWRDSRPDRDAGA